jgi:hypothetical protein
MSLAATLAGSDLGGGHFGHEPIVGVIPAAQEGHTVAGPDPKAEQPSGQPIAAAVHADGSGRRHSLHHTNLTPRQQERVLVPTVPVGWRRLLGSN